VRQRKEVEEARKVVEGEKERAGAADERARVAESQRNKLVKQVAKLRCVVLGLWGWDLVLQ
jgi:hypothetical protein